MAALFEMAKKPEPTLLVFFAALAHAQHLPKAVVVDADGNQDRHVLHAVAEAHLQEQAIEVEVGIARLDRSVAPPLDVLVDPLVELADRGGAHLRAP